MLSMERSIEFLRDLGVLTHISSMHDITTIMEIKRNGSEMEPNSKQLAECRLIYYLWAVLEDEEVQVRELKRVLLLLSGGQPNRGTIMRQNYGDREEIGQLLLAWDCLHQSNGSPLNDISIIKSKNDSDGYHSNK